MRSESAKWLETASSRAIPPLPFGPKALSTSSGWTSEYRKFAESWYTKENGEFDWAQFDRDQSANFIHNVEAAFGGMSADMWRNWNYQMHVFGEIRYSLYGKVW